MQAQEITDLQRRLDILAEQITASGMLQNWPPPQVSYKEPLPASVLPPLLAKRRIAIAKDQAFSFLYPHNIEWLEAMGASIDYFSPLHDLRLPHSDAIYLPGGFPELHIPALSQNLGLACDIRRHFQDNKPMVAECGGLLYCLQSLADKQGNRAPMLDLLTGHGKLQNQLVGLGMHSIELPQGQIRGHSFHHCLIENAASPYQYTQPQYEADAKGEAVYRRKGLFASFLHMHFPSNPHASASLFN
jgi:cobyrinic acid a,c-diamide synthase